MLKTANLAVAFLLELSLIFSVGYYGLYSADSKLWKYAGAIGYPLVVIVLWGIFNAPKSQYRLSTGYRIGFELTLYFIGAFLLYKTGRHSWAFALAIAALLNELLSLMWKQ